MKKQQAVDKKNNAIYQINGHKIDKKEEDFANSELMRLGESVFKSADKLKRLIK